MTAGQEVTAEAQERWGAALEAFKQGEAEGWNDSRCASTRRAFEAAVEAQGGAFAEAHYMAGLTAQRCGNEDDAMARFAVALEMDENHCKARIALGVRDLERGETGDAEAAFKLALERDPRCAEAYVNLAILQRERGEEGMVEALKNLRRALAVESEFMPAFNEMALLYLERARRAPPAEGRRTDSRDRWLDLAGVVCRQAQLVRSDYGPIYNTWGLVSVSKGDIIEAVRFFERATQLEPNMFEAYMNFGASTLSFRGYEDAQRAFARAVELRPRSYDAHIGLGAALRGLQRMDEAQAEYERALALEAGRPEAYFNLGVLYQDYRSGNVEDLERARGYFQQFLARAQAGGAQQQAVESVRRSCAQSNDRRRRGRGSDCRPGRLQNIGTAVDALRAAAAMQQGS